MKNQNENVLWEEGMYIRKYDKNYTRRFFLESLAAGLGAGVLMPVWDAIAQSGDISAAYPDEALDIETYSKGAVKPGGVLDASNIDAVKDLVDPIAYIQFKEQGRVADIVATTTDIRKLNPIDYLEATERNRGMAGFDAKGNVVVKNSGAPWIGGNPFPDATTGQEAIAGHTLSWGRHDALLYPILHTVVDREGNERYYYEFVGTEVQATGRIVLDPKPYQDPTKLRYNTFFFTAPSDVAGTSFLNIWDYDQTRFPELQGYLPAFKRIRRFPTNQRFEPLVPGTTAYLSDAWMMGDPYLTWGNYKLIRKQPLIGAMTGNWYPDDPNWIKPRVGGKTGKKFFRSTMELVPETFVVQCEPVGFPRSPYSKKWIWIDSRTLTPLAHVTFDRRGQLWKQWEGGFDTYAREGGPSVLGPTGNPFWEWVYVHSHDIQSDDNGLLLLARQLSSGYQLTINDPTIYNTFCTVTALQRLGM